MLPVPAQEHVVVQTRRRSLEFLEQPMADRRRCSSVVPLGLDVLVPTHVLGGSPPPVPKDRAALAPWLMVHRRAVAASPCDGKPVAEDRSVFLLLQAEGRAL